MKEDNSVQVTSNKRFIIAGFILSLLIGTAFLGYQFYPSKNSSQEQNSLQPQQATQRSGVIGYEYKTIKREGLDAIVPIITSYSDASTTKIVNESIEKQVFDCYEGYTTEELIESFQSRNGQYTDRKIAKMSLADIKNGLGWESSVATSSPVYAQNDLFSFSLSFDNYCGGAYPNAYPQGYTYDLKTGKLLSLEDIFANLDNDQVLNKLYTIFNNRYESTLGDDNREDCEGAFTAISPDSHAFYLEDNKIVLTPSFPHAIMACYSDIDVPIPEVQSYLKESSALRRIVAQ